MVTIQVFVQGLLLTGLLFQHAATQPVSKLPDLSTMLLPGPTIGGFSSGGGGMAVNLHVIHSSIFKAAAGFSSIFYYCNSGPRLTARTLCSNNRTTVATSLNKVNAFEKSGSIDPTSNLNGSKVFFWSGTSDTSVSTAVSSKNVDFYKTYTSKANIKFVTQNALHEFPTDDFDPTCPQPTTSFIGNCSFAGTFEMLSHFYGSSIKKPTGTVKTNQVVYFDQRELVAKDTPNSIGLDNSGFYYVPSRCDSGVVKCRLHFFLHGCSLGNQAYIPTFMDRIGLLKLAEINDIVMIFPRAAVNTAKNPMGCWDVYGYNNDSFAARTGAQVQFFWNIVDRIYGEK